MSDTGNNPVTDHVYDGIQEYDNPLPGWWTMLFYLTIIYSGGYLFINFCRPEWIDSNQVYEAKKTAELERMFSSLGDLQPDHATISGFMTDPEMTKWLAVGEAIFITNCVSCHGRDGAGISGPNMTDDSFLLVKKLTDIPTTIIDGSVAKGMPAWGNRIGPSEIVLVSAYVASLRGGNVSGRPAEGSRIPAWSDTAGE